MVLKINGDIGSHDPMLEAFGMPQPGFSAKALDEFLTANKDADEILMEVESNGGDLDEAFVIYDKLTTSGKTIIAHGFKVQSAATVIFLAAEKEDRHISPNAPFFIHNARIFGFSGVATADDLEEMSEYVAAGDRKMVDLYRKRLGLSAKQVSELKDLMKKETDLGADGAIKWGFAFKKLATKKAVAKAPAFAYTKDELKLAAKYIGQTKIKNKMSKGNWLKNILAKAGLTVQAAAVELADGSQLYYDGDLAVDTAVFTDEAMTEPAGDGDYELADGRTITVAGGVVTAIADPVTASSEDEVTVEEVEEVVTALVAKLKTLQAKNTKLESENKTLKATVKGEEVPGKKQTIKGKDEGKPTPSAWGFAQKKAAKKFK